MVRTVDAERPARRLARTRASTSEGRSRSRGTFPSFGARRRAISRQPRHAPGSRGASPGPPQAFASGVTPAGEPDVTPSMRTGAPGVVGRGHGKRLQFSCTGAGACCETGAAIRESLWVVGEPAGELVQDVWPVRQGGPAAVAACTYLWITRTGEGPEVTAWACSPAHGGSVWRREGARCRWRPRTLTERGLHRG